MSGFYDGYADYTNAYCDGIVRAINKLVELGKIDDTEAAELAVACMKPDPDPVDYSWKCKFAKKTTP